ncbi:MAG: sensor histidine kinase [Bacteroidales bacterium]
MGSCFRLRIVFRVVLIGVAMAWLVYVLGKEQWYVTTGVSVLVLVGLVIELVKFLEKTGRDLAHFLSSLESDDPAVMPVNRPANRSFEELYEAMSRVARRMEAARTDREVQYRYLQTVINHVEIAMICFREDGRVELVNRAALKLLGLERIKRLGDIESRDPSMYRVIREIKPGKRELLRFMSHSGMTKLSVSAAVFNLQGRGYRLISLQDIGTELEAQELESWQKLIRVLTHEIMNSVTPVSSLSNALNDMLAGENGDLRPLNSLDPGEVEDLYEGLRAIEQRSRGLLSFVGSYKNLTRLPDPQFRDVSLNDLVAGTVHLMKPQSGKSGVRVRQELLAENPHVLADPDMMERVLINLLQNALDILEGQAGGEVVVSTGTDREKGHWIEVRDNGPGIPPEILDKIFVPFFTTKKHGSGIGLSLIRQIMQLHKGSVSVRSTMGEGAAFIIRF